VSSRMALSKGWSDGCVAVIAVGRLLAAELDVGPGVVAGPPGDPDQSLLGGDNE
jgi:hypothetical protein